MKMTPENRQRLLDLFIDTGYGQAEDFCCQDDPVLTADTIDDFKHVRNNHWTDFGRTVSETEDSLVVEKVQAYKGQQRHDLIILDCGDFRSVLKI